MHPDNSKTQKDANEDTRKAMQTEVDVHIAVGDAIVRSADRVEGNEQSMKESLLSIAHYLGAIATKMNMDGLE